jgi:hypothetical protein
MTKHLPDVPPANRSPKGPDDPHAADKAAAPPKAHADVHIAEQGETANIMQNTTNKGYFQGRRMK